MLDTECGGPMYGRSSVWATKFQMGGSVRASSPHTHMTDLGGATLTIHDVPSGRTVEVDYTRYAPTETINELLTLELGESGSGTKIRGWVAVGEKGSLIGHTKLAELHGDNQHIWVARENEVYPYSERAFTTIVSTLERGVSFTMLTRTKPLPSEITAFVRDKTGWPAVKLVFKRTEITDSVVKLAEEWANFRRNDANGALIAVQQREPVTGGRRRRLRQRSSSRARGGWAPRRHGGRSTSRGVRRVKRARSQSRRRPSAQK
jgi:hypothetical protein